MKSCTEGTVPTPPGVRVQPTPVYETLAMGAITLVLWHLRDRFRPGVLFALYLFLSGLERLLVEFIRRNHHVVAGLTAPQLESAAAMIAGLAGIAWVSRHGGIRRAQPVATQRLSARSPVASGPPGT